MVLDEAVDGRVERLGVALVGVGAGDPRRGGAGAGSRSCSASSPARPASIRAEARVIARARSSPSSGFSAGLALRRLLRTFSAASSSLVTGHLPVSDQVADPGQRLGDVGGDRRRDQHLLGAGHEVGELVAPLGVELGEDVVEDQDRVVALGTQQVVSNT